MKQDQIFRERYNFTIIENEILDDEGRFSAQAKLVYVILCRFASQSGSCFPGIKTIAARVGCSENTVRAALRDLESLGAIRVERRFSDAGSMSNRYHLSGYLPARKNSPGEGGGVQQVKGGGSTGEGEQETIKKKNEVPGLKEVEDAYFSAWDSLYASGKVSIEKPVYDFPKSRALIRQRLGSVTSGLLQAAIAAATSDAWIVSNGFGIRLILSESVLNRLLSGAKPAGSKAPDAGDGLDDLSREILKGRRGQS